MKILLVAINAKYIHSNPAVYSLRACAAGYEGQVGIAEYTVNQREEKILADIYGRRPDVIAFSCYIWNIGVARRLMGDIGKLLPRVPIWCGGPEVSYDAEEFLREHPEVDGVMAGEGENTFGELVRFYDAKIRAGKGLKGSPPSLVRGLWCRDGEKIFYTGPREAAELDTIPFPYGNETDLSNRIVYYESGRGCPFSCTYCLSSIERGVRLKSMDRVRRELDFFLGHRTPQVKFIDRTFNCNREHAMGVWSYIRERDNGITNFHFEIAADLLSEEEMDFLASMRPGLVQLEIGVQSVNLETLARIRRKTDIGRVKRAVLRLGQGKNIHRHLDLIAGLPFEDFASFVRSFDQIYALGAEQLQLGFLKVLKGSPMRSEAADWGLVYRSEPPYEVLKTRWISYEELLKLKAAEEMLEIYYNSGQFRYTVAALERVFESPFALYYELSEFYREKGYAMMNPSRQYRYGILLEFAASREPGRRDYYAQLLNLDMYAREKLKSRPEFAADLRDREREIKSLCRREDVRAVLSGMGEGRAFTHMELFDYDLGDTEPLAPRGPSAVLFDYRNRNPLHNNAAAYYFER